MSVEKKDNAYYMNRKDDASRFKWDDGSLVAITLTRSVYQNKGITGMCGNYDGNEKNDVPPSSDIYRMANQYRLEGVMAYRIH